MEKSKVINQIAYIRTKFKQKFGIPRQSGRVPTLSGTIEFVDEYKKPESLKGLGEFSHIWIIFGFDKAKESASTVRPPRLGGNVRTGVFATRSPFRPNNLGLTLAKIVNVDYESCKITVSGVDLLDGTPIYDIKPYVPYADCVPDAKAGFADEFADYKLRVEFVPEVFDGVDETDKSTIIDCIGDDPRPAYKKDGDEVYKMQYGNFDVAFTVADGVATIIKIEKV